jgi:hypothetical protein
MYGKTYSKSKGVVKTTTNSIPVILIILINFLNTQFNLGFNETTINEILGILSIIYYWFFNWLKNRTSK